MFVSGRVVVELVGKVTGLLHSKSVRTCSLSVAVAINLFHSNCIAAADIPLLMGTQNSYYFFCLLCYYKILLPKILLFGYPA